MIYKQKALPWWIFRLWGISAIITKLYPAGACFSSCTYILARVKSGSETTHLEDMHSEHYHRHCQKNHYSSSNDSTLLHTLANIWIEQNFSNLIGQKKRGGNYCFNLHFPILIKVFYHMLTNQLYFLVRYSLTQSLWANSPNTSNTCTILLSIFVSSLH